jgi:glutamate decarboxylase
MMPYQIVHDELITDGSELPVFAFKVRDDVSGFSAFDVSGGMRERGWQVPAY